MVDALKNVISDYQKRLLDKPFAPSSSFGRAVFGDDGCANKLFLTYLFFELHVGIQFLKDTGLIRTQMTCNTCGRDMVWTPHKQRIDRFIWACRRRAATVCNHLKCIKHGSWFQHYHLTFQEVLFLTYDIVRRHHWLEQLHNLPFHIILITRCLSSASAQVVINSQVPYHIHCFHNYSMSPHYISDSPAHYISDSPWRGLLAALYAILLTHLVPFHHMIVQLSRCCCLINLKYFAESV
jgi:hypothetical protein